MAIFDSKLVLKIQVNERPDIERLGLIAMHSNNHRIGHPGET